MKMKTVITLAWHLGIPDVELFPYLQTKEEIEQAIVGMVSRSELQENHTHPLTIKEAEYGKEYNIQENEPGVSISRHVGSASIEHVLQAGENLFALKQVFI